MNIPHLPLVSILLPVYNCEKYLASSVESILNQSFSDFELIIVNDGSTDNTLQIIKTFTDHRIVLVDQMNQGLAKALNNGIKLSRGKYIARQDADDLSYKERLLKQVNYLDTHAHVGLVGTWARIVNEEGSDTGRTHLHATENCSLKFDLCFDNPFVHSSVMFRREVIEQVGVYDPSIHSLIQDFEYWHRISKKFEIGNVNEVLLDYREISSSISRTTESFSSVVAEQAAKNIVIYLPEALKNYGIILAQLYHDTINSSINTTTFNILMQCLDTLYQRINSTNACNNLEPKVRQYKFAIRYKYYNSFIYSNNSSFITKLVFRTKRILL